MLLVAIKLGGMFVQMKKRIEEFITIGNFELAWKEINEYEMKNFNDCDISTYKALCLLGLGRYGEALECAKVAVKMEPYVANVHFNCGYIFMQCGKYFEAYEEYAIAKELSLGGNSFEFDIDELDASMQEILDSMLENAQLGLISIGSIEKKWVDYITVQNSFNWGIRHPIFHDGTSLIAQEYMDYPLLPKMFLGINGLQSVYHYWTQSLNSNTVEEEVEIQRVTELCNEIEIVAEKNSFVPIVTNRPAQLTFKVNDVDAEISYNSPLQYVNYRIPKGKTIISSENCMFRVGEVVPITHSCDRKKLVLNIFVDGLSQTVLENSMEEIMPYTYRFFKKGMICTNAHTAGDWTFPSIASVVTGQSLAKHKMLHSKLLRKLDIDTPILYEYFKNAGYNTTKIGGNWRIAPNYGYARGMNRIKYQHMYNGLTVEKVVSETMDQMYNMRETDQFIWMEIGELHLIADEINTAPLHSEFMVWENESLNEKINSVKQDYDETKKNYYIKQIQYVDRKLAALYQYIEDNYKDDEIIISLFSDHGQGYLVHPEDEFLCNERTKIAFMTRGGEVEGTSGELISACDYSSILCKLAGIDYDYKNTDASLPVIYGGKREKEFVITESIHVGDPYQIVLNGKDFSFYLNGKENVTSECKVPLKEYEVKLLDKEGNNINDARRIDYYTQWCLEHIAPCKIYEANLEE